MMKSPILKQIQSKKRMKEYQAGLLPKFVQEIQPTKEQILDRQLEVEQLATSLIQKGTKGALLLGKVGTGRMSIVQELVNQVHQGSLPALAHKTFLMYTGRTTNSAGVVDDVFKQLDKIPGLVMVVKAEDTRSIQSLFDFEAVLSLPFKVVIIGDTKDPRDELQVGERLEKIKVDVLSVATQKIILNRKLKQYAKKYRVTYPPKVVDRAIRLITIKHQEQQDVVGPALQLLSMAGANLRIRKSGVDKKVTVTPDDLSRVHRLTELGGQVLKKQLDSQIKTADLKTLQTALANRVVGQRDVTDQIARAIIRAQLGINDPTRPLGCYAFFGTTGVGKTETAKVLADEAFDGNLIRVDMSELEEDWGSSKILGTAPGYLGYGDTKTLVDRINEKPASVVLFDEMEKANIKILDLLLQVMDDGILTDSKGTVGDFTKAIIVLTSNLGASALRTRRQVGFGTSEALETDYRAVIQSVREAINQTLRPELVNRLDNQFIFHPLNHQSMVTITQHLLEQLMKRLEERKIFLTVGDNVAEWIVKNYTDPANGARPLKRAITTEVEDGLAAAMMAAGNQERGYYHCSIAEEELVVEQSYLAG